MEKNLGALFVVTYYETLREHTDQSTGGQNQQNF